MSESRATLLALILRHQHLLPPVSAAVLARMDGTDPDPALDVDIPPAAAPWPPLDEAGAHDRALGCLLGLAVGEAIGASVEGQVRGSFPPVAAPSGGGLWGLAPGAWGDGTAMALSLADSLLSYGTVDLEDFLFRLKAWLETGENAVAGRSLDADPAVRPAVARFTAKGEFAAIDAPGGNGALVRLASLAIFAGQDSGMADELAARQCRATHAGVESLDACRLFVSQLGDALNGADKAAALRPRVMALCPRVLFVNAGEWRDKPREVIAASGEVVETLEAGLWAVGQGTNFRDTVRAAAGLGGNAMGAAAVAGQLAGALYGASAIPAKWLAVLAERDRIAFTADDLFQARLPAPGQ